MKILITGDSHTGALAQGATALKPDLPPGVEILVKPLGGGHILPTPFFEDRGSHAEIVAPEYRRNFHRLPPRAFKADAVVLSAPLWPMRVMHAMVWAKHGIDAPVPGGQPISRAVFRRIVSEDQRYVLGFCEVLRRVGMPVIAISPPVMFRDHSTLKHMDPHGVRAMFDLYREIMLAGLAERQIPVIDVPPDCLDADGFMLPDYRHPDPKDEHHANAAFGRLMIERFVADLRTLVPVEAPAG